MRVVLLLLRRLVPGVFYDVITILAMNAVRRQHGGEIRIASQFYYGANYIDPKHLVVWYLVATNAEMNEAKSSGIEQAMAAETRRQLLRRGYPAEAIDKIHVGIESNENIEKAGGAYRYFK